MKLKASVNILNKKVLFALFGAMGLVFTALRFYQMNFLTDPETGFFTQKSHISVVVYYVLWALGILLPLALCYISSHCKTEAFVPRRSIFTGFASLAMGATALIKSISDFNALKAKSAGLKFFFYVKEFKATIELAGVILGFLAAAVFLINAVALISGGKYMPSLKLCQLLPSLWMFALTIVHFKVNVSYLNVTQLMLQIFADAFLMLFFFELARFISDVGVFESDWLVYASGFSALILTCAASLPNLVFYLGGSTEKLVAHCPFNWYSPVSIVYVIAGLLLVAGNRASRAIPIEPVDVPQAENDSEEDNAQ